VTFKDNGVAITGCSNRPLTAGQATCDTAALAPGNHPISADYSGDGNFAASTGTLSGGQVVKPDVSVTVSPASMDEDDSGALVYTFTRNGSTADPLTVNFSVSGTATFTTDYTQTSAATFNSSSGTVTFLLGSSIAVVNIDPATDIAVEANETVILTVTAGTGYSVGSPAAATGTIRNDDADYQLILDESGPDPRQAVALESVLLLRDPFRIQRLETWLNLGADPNTRVILFVNNLTFASGDTVVVNLVDGSNQMIYDVPAEDVRPVPGTAFKQVMFRLPDSLTPGSTCTVRIKAHGQTGNKGTFRIQ
jgi:Big-like domain-containing protein